MVKYVSHYDMCKDYIRCDNCNNLGYINNISIVEGEYLSDYHNYDIVGDEYLMDHIDHINCVFCNKHLFIDINNKYANICYARSMYPNELYVFNIKNITEIIIFKLLLCNKYSAIVSNIIEFILPKHIEYIGNYLHNKYVSCIDNLDYKEHYMNGLNQNNPLNLFKYLQIKFDREYDSD
jgi:hypothetical protein